MKFLSLEYLQSGNKRQKAAYECLNSLGIFPQLSEYHPILTGTIPIDVDVADSDLDVICFANDLISFQYFIRQEYSHLEGYKDDIHNIGNVPSFVANFCYREFKIELFCQAIPTQQQNSYIHMIVEDRLLALAHPLARLKIRELKLQGIKTEPAFAKIFGLVGNPYQALLDLYLISNDEMKSIAYRWRP